MKIPKRRVPPTSGQILAEIRAVFYLHLLAVCALAFVVLTQGMDYRPAWLKWLACVAFFGGVFLGTPLAILAHAFGIVTDHSR